MGRPRKEIDLAKLGKLASLLVSIEDAAILLDVGRETLKRRLKDDEEIRRVWDRGRAEARQNLRAAQLSAALGGWSVSPATGKEIYRQPSITMQIWLGKNELDQTDKIDADLTSAGMPFAEFTLSIPKPARFEDDSGE